MHQHWRRTAGVAAAAAALCLAWSGVAAADNVVVDGDDAVPVATNGLSFGTVCVAPGGTTAHASALVALSHNGNGQVFASGSTATVAVQSVTGAGLGATMASSTITLPADWSTAANNTMSTPVSANVSLAVPATPGTYSGSVNFVATGTSAKGDAISRTASLSVTATFSNTGNCAPPAPADTTAPTVTLSMPTPIKGQNGWFDAGDVTPVVGMVTASDPSGVTGITCTGGTVSDRTGLGGTTATASVTVAGDGTHDVACTATDGASPANTGAAAGSAATATVKIDTAAPVITDGGPTPGAPDGAGGWYVSAVGEQFSAADSGSGLTDCTSPWSVSSGTAEGSAVTIASGTCTDVAGNVAASVTAGPYMIDLTAPAIADNGATPSTPDGTNGWYVSPVSEQFAASDATSGLADCAASWNVSSGTTEGSAVSIASGACTDNAGNGTPGITAGPYKIDLTAPVVTDDGPTPNAPDGANGWYVSPVSEHFSATDATSGLADCPAGWDVTSGTREGNAVSIASGRCTDNAGNATSGVQAGPYQVDLTDPGVSCTSATFLLGQQNPSVTATVTDAGSGPAAAQVGATADTSAVGPHSVQVTGYDRAGRSTTVTCSYSVVYDWHGFFAPVNNTPVLNVAKAGSAIPVKFSLSGNQGLSILAAGSPQSAPMSCSSQTVTDQIESTVTAGSSSLSYDATADQYVYVWKTDKTWAGTCRQLSVTLADGSVHKAWFSLTK